MSWKDILKVEDKLRRLAEEFAPEEMTFEERTWAKEHGREYIPKEDIIIEPYYFEDSKQTLKHQWDSGGPKFILKAQEPKKEWEKAWNGDMHDVNGNVEFSHKKYFQVGKYDAKIRIKGKAYPVVIDVYDKALFYVE